MEGVVGWAMTDGRCQLPCYVGQRVSESFHCFQGVWCTVTTHSQAQSPDTNYVTKDEDKCGPKTRQKYRSDTFDQRELATPEYSSGRYILL